MPHDNSGDWASQAQIEPHQLEGGHTVPYWDKSWWEEYRRARSIRERNEIITKLVDQMPVKWNTLPQLPFWAPLFNVTQDQYKVDVGQRLMATSFLLGHQPLDREDIDLVAYGAAKRSVTNAYARPAIALGAGVCWAVGYNKYNFPFWKPKPASFNPEIFPSQRFTLATGHRATLAWQGVRIAAWYVTWRIFGGWIADAYAETVFSATLMRNKAFKQKLLEAGQAMKANSITHERPELRDAYSVEHEPDHDHQEDQQQLPQHAQTPYYQRIQQHQQEQKQQHQMQQQQQRRQQTQQSTYSHDDDDYLFDDASPVAPAARGTGTVSSPVAQSSGSAWDRLRQQAMGGPAQAPGSTTAPTAAIYAKPSQSRLWAERRAAAVGGREDGLSHSYLETDQERALAKEQAQREFDAMLERERRGDGSSHRRGL
ncbi:hypothetical protein GE21DRAFT_9327 [Neurospora crassa]|uniref:Uncharacterized protein n=1 Tax=Neurospora crassa (strain ATCC 24698 / 74-OR23-1A / CBS 708.71 / DSM 1257 / FGSC 987) TaxID=367110 RepID=Q7S2E9_NEUCR|nr:hypothetical protein NCU06008 [Neurospora crassa OR74A]EAA29580.3 hypothetical protein NCU06008 [Neurospora crassa OR74A]KHE87438.1 hypothetical protein GE21DRAFT_9327 [Neurospora crassa]|eukprot:XP_958816.3 hypothetical protein NCU06008 [Neurospora crassa OR74A]